ncbi:ComEC family competence protein [Cellulophaga sp. 20_2_10]|uniref:ComEC/Rec2 family competence protein n=1 Tax=Cellulophaga sp. 20_2_10 TaxID=2942476 RepID=UPI00201A4665|nr:ComEC/Rec2 family competence protein [Cellulophaga sp. 20_2_10]MCL5246775.1 ComEC family competence protein [Cellulophaga sp. 20_2_10]
MKPFEFISVKLALCLITGILLQQLLKISVTVSFCILLSLIVILGFLYITSKKRALRFGIIAAVTTIALGVCTSSTSNPKNNRLHYTNKAYSSIPLWHLKIDETLKPNPYSKRYIATIKSINGEKSFGKILLNVPIDSTSTNFKVDDELNSIGDVVNTNKPLNPHQFNYASYLEDLGIYHQIEIKQNYTRIQSTSKTLKGLAATARENIITKLNAANFNKQELSIIKALLLGERNNIDPDTLTAYKNAGAIHILALSGLHIGILLLVLQFLLSPLEYLPKGKIIKLITIVILLWSFALLAGLSSSLIRAVTMFTFVAYALYLNRPTSSFNILALSLFFILLLQPNLLFSVGLQMSYAAVFSIVLFNPIFQKVWEPKYWLTSKIWQLTTVSFAAQLGVLPISLYYFHQFPSLFFITNLAIIPFLGIILGLGIVVIALALCNVLPTFLVQIYNNIILAMNTVVKWVATQDAFLIKDISFNKPQVLLSYAALVLLLMVIAKNNFKRTALLLCSIALFQGVIIFYNYKANTQERLYVLHKSRNTILMHQTGKTLKIVSSDSVKNNQTFNAIRIAERIDATSRLKLKNNYNYKGHTIIIVDSLAVYPTTKNNTILLTQSAKLNLDRLITEVNPKEIIADGSNYKSTVSLWRKTCLKRKIPFHYTGEKGFYVFD